MNWGVKFNSLLVTVQGNFSETSLLAVESMLFGETDWQNQFETGKGPGPEKESNYHTGTPKTVSLGQGMIAKTGVKGNLGKQKVNTESEMLSGVALPKGPGNPQGGSSKDVQGLRQLG
jgi:hypothetical protein